ncbi:MAG: 50S ribosomal protein L37ae [Candidatus Aenigmarchaeota archaeon]|nr:50S ribosomal protein L37ae [Candidatus Aenigmarchaeota archaeon]
MKTKKRGASGRFGSRYGKSISTNFAKVEKLKSEKWRCPRCLKQTVKRESAGIWSCSSCGHRFAGKAFKPS